jgi:hypothetical protein
MINYFTSKDGQVEFVQYDGCNYNLFNNPNFVFIESFQTKEKFLSKYKDLEVLIRNIPDWQNGNAPVL